MLWDGTTSDATLYQRGDYYASVRIGFRSTVYTGDNYRLMVQGGRDTASGAGTVNQGVARFYIAAGTTAFTISDVGLATASLGLTVLSGLTVSTGGITLSSGNNLTLASGNINITAGDINMTSGDFTIATGDINIQNGGAKFGTSGSSSTVAGEILYNPVVQVNLGTFPSSATTYTYQIPRLGAFQRFIATITTGSGGYKPIVFQSTSVFGQGRIFYIQVENSASSTEDLRVQYGDSTGAKDIWLPKQSNGNMFRADIPPGNVGIFHFMESTTLYSGSPGLLFIGGSITAFDP
jgi:hypothetical protein